MTVLRPGFVGANRRRGVAITPTGAHRYWRIVFTGVASGSRVSLAEIEFLDRRYYRRKDGTFSASGFTSGVVGPSYAVDGNYTRSTSSAFWQSNTGSTPIWFKIDAGDGQDFVCEGITLARGALATTFSGLEIQWSDDDSTWTTEWVIDDVSEYANTPGTGGGYQATSPPVTYTNPNVQTFTPTDGFSKTGILLWLKSYDSVYTDEYITPAGNGDPVRTAINHAGGVLEFRQDTETNRPILRHGGLSGLPYLEFDRSLEHFFQDFAYSMSSGLTNTPPGRFAALGDVGDMEWGDDYGLIGNEVASKSIITVRQLPTALIRLHNNVYTEFNNNGRGHFGFFNFAVGWGPWSAQALHLMNSYGKTYGAVTGSTTVRSTVVTSAQLFRNTNRPDGGYFHGKVYELILCQNTSEGDAFGQVQAYHMFQYLEGRRLLGMGGSLPDDRVLLRVNNGVDRFRPSIFDRMLMR